MTRARLLAEASSLELEQWRARDRARAREENGSR